MSALLAANRITVTSHASLDDLTPALLAPYHLVVLYQHRMVPRLTPAIRRGLAALRRICHHLQQSPVRIA